MKKLFQSFDSVNKEGEFGRVLSTKKINHIKLVEQEHRFTFKLMTGDVLPREIITIPIVVEDQVKVVISLAKMEPFSREHTSIINQLQTSLNVKLAKIYANERSDLLTLELTSKNRFLVENEKTLQEQTQNLSDKNKQLNQSIESLQEAQARLVSQEKLASIGGMTAGIAHEIKNPLNFIKNFAQLSGEHTAEIRKIISELEIPLPEEKKSALEEIIERLTKGMGIIQKNSDTADNIIKNMLLLSRGNKGTFLSENINKMLDEYINLAFYAARAKDLTTDVEVITNLDPSLTTVDIVPQDMGRALINLLSNAFDAVSEDLKKPENWSPKVTLSSKLVNETVEISINDNGSGIPDTIKDDLFTPFFTTKPAGSGTGLGLAICHDIIVREHNGQIKLRSEEGVFTEFLITLPLKHIVAD
ncbi:MAG: GHKL domain-containing protein [Proteobacteria bacterium]|nr:GHKL domain-containing protein [Pseudomonadota bacterium]